MSTITTTQETAIREWLTDPRTAKAVWLRLQQYDTWVVQEVLGALSVEFTSTGGGRDGQ